jgi:hypothetical protein
MLRVRGMITHPYNLVDRVRARQPHTGIATKVVVVTVLLPLTLTLLLFALTVRIVRAYTGV